MTGNFLERWSRLKREAVTKDGGSEEGAQNPPQSLQLTAEQIQELIESLPDLATMGNESDFSVFMQAWVPEDLRRDALRRLWTVDKSVIEHVPLADYALDYNTPGAAPGYGTIVTTAEMVADVARMMGKAAFPEKQAESDVGEAAPAAHAEGAAEPLESQAETAGADAGEKKPAAPETTAPDMPVGHKPASDFAAVREDLEAAHAFDAIKRRHGAAAPR